MKSSGDRAYEKSGEEVPRYNLRHKKRVEKVREAKMADKNGERSSSDDENDCAIVQQDKVIEELREQIKALQKSLASSEKEKVQYIETLNQQTANNVISADVPSIEAIPVSFKPTEVTSANFTTVSATSASAIPAETYSFNNNYANANANFAGATTASTNYANDTYASATSANANFAGATTASTNYANATYASATSANANFAGATIASTNYANATSASVTSANANFAGATTASTNYANATSASVTSANVKPDAAFGPYIRSATCPPAIMQAYCHTSPYSLNLLPASYMPAASNPQITPQLINQKVQIAPSASQVRKILDLPDFHGSPEEWPMFSVAFKETTEMNSYSRLENLLRLQKALKGKARQQVESLLIHPSSVDAAMKTLEFHYGRPELLIRSQIAKVRAFPPVTGGRIADILNFSTMVSNLAAFLEKSGAVPHLNNPMLLDELISKLPLNKREEWTRHIFEMQKPYPTVREFSNWLQHTAMYVSMAIDVMPTKYMPNDFVCHKPKMSSKPVMTVTKEEKKCLVCDQSHILNTCSKFKDADCSNRWSIVKNKHLCFCCLQPGHSVQNCRKRRVCGISSCNKFHNRLLHSSSDNNKNNISSADKAVATVQTVYQNPQHPLARSNSPQRNKTLLKYLPVKLKGPKGEINIFAFIDEGAKISLLEENIANVLGLKGKSNLLRLKWIGNQSMSEQSRQVSLEIAGANEAATSYEMRGVRTTKKLYLPQQTLNLNDFIQRHEQLANIPIADYNNAVPQILIGLSHTELIRTIKTVNLDDGFAIHKTMLGWTLLGSNEYRSSEGTIGHVNIESTAQLNEISKQITEYFAAEKFEIKQLPSVRSEADIRAEKLLNETTRFVNNNRYETGLLWHKDNVKFPESFSMAMKRLEQIEMKMEREKDYGEWYKAKINEYIEKEYAKRLSPDEANVNADRTWYLPHFATCNVNKGNKRRLVFDAAAKINNMSLNCALMKGPEEYQPKSLLAILCRFRQGKFAVCGDICEMFHRILIRHEDQNAQRFLWRGGDRSKPPDVYVMRAMIFGSISSPCSAQFVKNVHAEKYRDVNARAVNAIVDRHYVDDYMDSFDTVEECIKVTKDVIDIHSHAGFQLRGLTSNSYDILQAVLHNEQPCKQQRNYICQGESATEKVLGMHWNPNKDYFFFKLLFSRVPKAVLDCSRRPTKGEMLSVTMSIFDPLGFACGLVLRAKVLMQSLWTRSIDWHEPIPEDIYKKWLQWYKTLNTIENLKMPRCYGIQFLNPNADIQLHIFVDASEIAFAAIAFWRIHHANNTDIVFVAGRSRCSPLKPLSIPRLELQAAVLGIKLREAVINSHDVQPRESTFWSDSKIVLQWIRSDARCYKQFVAHRIAEILQTSEASQWRWVPGKENPADDATRIKTFSQNGKWLNGPPFLKLPEHSWPGMPTEFDNSECQEERRSKQIYTISSADRVIPFNKYSNYYKLLRVMTWVRYAIMKFRKVDERRNVYASKLIIANEIKQTELLICLLVQQDVFADEVESLRKGAPITKCSSIFKLSPMLDNEGLIRLGGRIDYTECVPMSTKRPIILPRSHPISRLVAKHYHELFHHHNFESALCAIRRKFWIPSARRLLRSIKAKCQKCKNLSAIPESPLMGQVPSDRVTPFVRPFTYSGVDYFGPVLVAIGRRQEKRWVALFTCLTIRTIHLELARDLSTDAAIIVCRNFINRRGVPVRLRSDMGTNFVGASKEDWVNVQSGMQSECDLRGVEWVFNAPANPSAGGIWERMVRSVKRVLMFTLKERAPQLETLQSLLIEAENLINSRPLTHVPVESTDAEPLSPNHFLLGCANDVQTPPLSEKICLRKQWHIAQQLKQTFWKRWILEYLPTLTLKPIAVGDIVIVCDDNESRGHWKRGIVTEAKPAPDGQVRSVLVKTSTGILRRPASKIAVLDVGSDSLTSDANHGGEDVTD
ncbi:uncharacterized protein LOC128870108 [Anastrepha ludens]|uniref:uncharacterized protein LOC128870108 n=1 Tax=Anastrepha ludens TaxID=28586 RepID=UPI0023B0D992|nr:uncharacterized protein LOC128870108 [Anastrepha ludens]